LESERPLYDPHTLVNQAVEAAKKTPASKAQANFINACLRRFLREREALALATDSDPVARWNYPLWWIERMQQERPHDWAEILQAGNAHAPMTLRVNLRKHSLAQYTAALQAAGLAATPGLGAALHLLHPVPVHNLPGFDQGWVSVQDSAAQMAAAQLLAAWRPRGRGRILDACAAPGGKTAHLLELCDAEVIALDQDAVRCSRIGENLARLDLGAQVVCADAGDPSSWWDGKYFDAILLDAPCTASGIVRRHPDVRWLRRPTDIAKLAQQQARLLKGLWKLLYPGGRLLYCTCSVFLAEGQRQVETFLAHNTDAVLLPSVGHLMPSNGVKTGAIPDNCPRDNDGFFFALLEKRMA
jgi:16S rRNA (cytosine967-C5)-methyltransferase